MVQDNSAYARATEGEANALGKVSHSGNLSWGSAILFTLIGRIAAAATPEFCLPPEQPIAADTDLAAAYRTEILADYERFWAESSDYVRCLDEERSRALAEIQDSLADYQAVFDAKPPAPSSLPTSGD